MAVTRSSGQVCNLAAGFVLGLWLTASAVLGMCGCAADAMKPETDEAEFREPVPLAKGNKQTERLCGRGRKDVVLDAFCPDAPQVGGLLDLRRVLGLQSNDNVVDQGYALIAHSTSLALRVVSAINPRVIFVRPQSSDGKIELISIAFARGEQTAELVARDRETGTLQFYLVTFTQDCNANPGGCSAGDLLTSAVESDWHDVNVYAEEDVQNTPSDCRVCHQPDGPGTPKILRMQEREPPWNHWLWRQSISGKAVLADYAAAKGDETFAGLSGDEIRTSQPGLLTFALFSVDSGMQPNEFVSAQIEQEVMSSAAEMGGDQPADNSVPGESKTWQAIYETAKRGEAIAVPYHDVKITDGAKLAEMTKAYVDYREGRLDRGALPDIREVFLDDPQRRAEMGFATEPGLDGKGVLLQACAQCHNDRLDQGVSRARFHTDLGKLDRIEKNRAIARLRLPVGQAGAMPPPAVRSLDDKARDRLIELLSR